MTYHLFLDDERKPGDVTWVEIPSANYMVARDYRDFTNMVGHYGVPKFVTFDHDLGADHYKAMLRDCQENSTGQLAFEVKDVVSDFDYGTEKTGLDCAKWLVDYCIERGMKFPEYQVHSMNPVGSKRIRDYIEWSKTKFCFL